MQPDLTDLELANAKCESLASLLNAAVQENATLRAIVKRAQTKEADADAVPA